jgi:hypothetical protein
MLLTTCSMGDRGIGRSWAAHTVGLAFGLGDGEVSTAMFAAVFISDAAKGLLSPDESNSAMPRIARFFRYKTPQHGQVK